MLPRDTSRAAREVQLRVYRTLEPSRKVELAFEMSEDAIAVSVAGSLAGDPTLDPETALARVRRRILGPALYDAAYSRAERD